MIFVGHLSARRTNVTDVLELYFIFVPRIHDLAYNKAHDPSSIILHTHSIHPHLCHWLLAFFIFSYHILRLITSFFPFSFPTALLAVIHLQRSSLPGIMLGFGTASWLLALDIYRSSLLNECSCVMSMLPFIPNLNRVGSCGSTRKYFYSWPTADATSIPWVDRLIDTNGHMRSYLL
jgi:hypothetical protein